MVGSGSLTRPVPDLQNTNTAAESIAGPARGVQFYETVAIFSCWAQQSMRHLQYSHIGPRNL